MESAMVQKKDYLLNLDIDGLKNLAIVFNNKSRSEHVAYLNEVIIILDTKRSDLNPEEQRVYDKFKDRQQEITELRDRMIQLNAEGNRNLPTTSHMMHAIPSKNWEPPSISLVPLSGGTVWTQDANFKVGTDVANWFGESTDTGAVQDISREGVILYAKAYAMSLNPHLSPSALKNAAIQLGNYLNEHEVLEKDNPTMRNIITRLMNGDASAIKELNDTPFGQGLQQDAAASGLVVYDGTALTRYRGSTVFRVTNPKGTEEFDRFIEGAGKSPGFVFLNWFLALEYAMLEVGKNTFTLDPKTNEVRMERGSEIGHKATARTGVQLGTTDPLTWLGVWDQPMVIEISAEIGWAKGGSNDPKGQFYLGVQSVDFMFPGKEAERLPVRLVGAGVKHTGTNFRENYLGYAILNVPLTRAGSVDVDLNLSPYITNFFGLLYGGAEMEVMTTIFKLNKEKNQYIGVGVGADVWSGVNAFDQRETGVDPYAKIDLNLKWMKVSLRGGYKGLLDKKYGQGGFDATLGFEFIF